MLEKPTYLNEIEEAEVQKFLENPTMLEAVKKVLLANIYFQGKLEKGKPADEGNNIFMAQLTQPMVENAPADIYALQVKSLVNGIRILETGFQKLETLKKVEPVKPKAPKGR